jgi:hypothetical protein
VLATITGERATDIIHCGELALTVAACIHLVSARIDQFSFRRMAFRHGATSGDEPSNMDARIGPLSCHSAAIAIRSALPMKFTPQRLVRIPEAFNNADWIFEPKIDGFRALAHVQAHRSTLVSR